MEKMRDVVVDVEYYPYKVYVHEGKMFVDGTCLDLFGVNRTESNPAFYDWSRERYFEITEEDIRKTKNIRKTPEYEYVPEYVDLSEDLYIDMTRTLEDARYMKSVTPDKFAFINETYKKIIESNDDSWEKNRYELKIRALELIRTNAYNNDLGHIMLRAIRNRANMPKLLEDRSAGK